MTTTKPMHLGHVVEADGRWRIFLFAGAHVAHCLPLDAHGELADFFNAFMLDCPAP